MNEQKELVVMGQRSRSISARLKKVGGGNLVALWNLNDTSGPSILDSSGNGYNGYYWPILLNNGFELAGAGGADVFLNWSESALTGAIARTTTAGEFRSGVAGCKLTAGASADTRVLYNFLCVAGQSYKFFFWTRGDGTNAGRYQIENVTAGNDIIARTSTLITGTTFTMVTLAFTIPAGCTTARVDLWCPAANGGIAYYDDTNLELTTDFGATGADGKACINFTGANAIDVYSSGLVGALDWTKGTIYMRLKIAAAQWADGVVRYALRFKTQAGDPNNAVCIAKQTTANTLVFQYVDTTVSRAWSIDTSGNLSWMSVALTWDATAGIARAFYNGVQVGADLETGTWSGAFDGTRCMIGSENNADNSYRFIGCGQYAALYKVALTPVQIRKISIP
jgi:hypothetical protein